jgi:hypothetical protein
MLTDSQRDFEPCYTAVMPFSLALDYLEGERMLPMVRKKE